jgi:hypothetical protein
MPHADTHATPAGVAAPPVLELGAIRLRPWRNTDAQRLIEVANEPGGSPLHPAHTAASQP